MSGTDEKERTRLFTQDEALRKEADIILDKSGIEKVLLKNDFHPVGSYVMKTMTWRDVDFERYDENPDCDTQWELGKELAQLEWVWNLHCNDAYKDPRTPGSSGLYWGIKVTEPESGNIWRIDLWTARREEFERIAPNRNTWYSKINDNTRFTILSIKDKLKDFPELQRTYLSSRVYQAVLEHGIKNIEEFRSWWEANWGKFDERPPEL